MIIAVATDLLPDVSDMFDIPDFNGPAWCEVSGWNLKSYESNPEVIHSETSANIPKQDGSQVDFSKATSNPLLFHRWADTRHYGR